MTRLEQLQALQARLQAATGPDRELDIKLNILSYGEPLNPNTVKPEGPIWKLEGDYVYASFPTASIDDALALAKRRLPGWRTGQSVEFSSGNWSWSFESKEWPSTATASAPTAPLAILGALVAVLIEQEQSK